MRGKAIRAIAQNERGASLLGINVPRTKAWTFGLSTSLAGLSGGLLATIYYIYPTVGGLFLFTAFTMATLGGLGSVTGALVAGLFLGVAESLLAAFISIEVETLFVFILVIVVLVLKPSGLLGKG